MFPENRYVRERNERQISWPKTSESTPISSPASPDPVELEKENPKALAQIEKRIPENRRLLPDGGARRLDYQGLLSQKELDLIEKNYPVYKEAENRTGVNWKILAAIHYRESSLGRNSSSSAKGNEFQFDGKYKRLASGNFLKDTVTAGKILQEKNSQTQKTPLSENEFAGGKVQEALFRYNGRVYKQAERSPYVMNQFDENHQNMRIYLGPNTNPRWGVDHRLGAYTVIRELHRAFIA